MMQEKVKRLAPKTKTLRELYLLSGNQCAFPGCTHAMVNENGIFVGEICHIEAALPHGERFNSNMTNEDRRSISNLMLMCHDHHVITNDVNAYPVERLQEIKKNHELQFKSVIGQMKAAVIDYGKSTASKPAQNGNRLNRVLSWGLSEEELKITLITINGIVDVLHDIPIQTRDFLGIMIMRSHEGSFDREGVVSIDEVRFATGLSNSEIASHVEILCRKRITSDIDYNDSSRCNECSLFGEDGWNYWVDIQDFCNKTGIDISKICTDLDFTVFDE